jgi:peptidoglycan/LPS O-acetylase OafA/YrhL
MNKSFSPFLEKFRRITSGSGYMPEIDGLRFIAIGWVVVLMHLTNIINTNLYNGQMHTSTFISKIVLEGGHGVSFFFMISGFILALPFVKERLYNGNKVSLRKYYWRRLTRLEPPYIAALLIAFVLLVFVVKKYSFEDLSNNFLASLFYLHDLIFQEHSKVLPIAWSLEVEAQFYILAPFLSFVFFIKQNFFRRVLLFSVATWGNIIEYNDLWNPGSPFINFVCYFLMGMLLADLYCAKWKLLDNGQLCCWSGIIIFAGLHFIFSVDAKELFLLKMYLMTIFFYIAVTNQWWKKLLSIQWVSIIGGMCYSIYLLHLLIMSAVTKVLVKMPVENKLLGFVVYGIIILAVVLVGSAVFYRLIEQPCMRRDWWRNIFKRKSPVLTED